jgi:hypothetical protein
MTHWTNSSASQAPDWNLNAGHLRRNQNGLIASIIDQHE